MKATKKIVGATAALVAALALSAGSTFAWFAGTTNVTATGMNIQVTVPTTLYIEKGYQISADAINKTTITMDNTAAKLSPATIKNLAGETTSVDVEIATGYSEQPTVGTPGKANAFDTVGTIQVDNGLQNADSYTASNYAVVELMSVVLKADASAEEATYGLDATVTVSNILDVDKSNKFLRIGILANGKWSIMSGDLPVASQSATVTFDDIATSVNNNAPVNIALVVWYEGSDPDCYSNNAISVANMNIAVSFTKAN